MPLKIKIPKDIQEINLYSFVNTEKQHSEGRASMMYVEGHTLNDTKYVSENQNSKLFPSKTLHRLIYAKQRLRVNDGSW
jgi:hypothetical protein